MKIFKTTFVFFVSFFICTYTFATADEYCGTENLDSATFVSLPWIENNQFLLNLVDSIGGSCNNCRIANDGLSTKKFQVPIKAVVFYNNNYPGITDGQVQQYIREVNRILHENGVGIQFYLVCEVFRSLSVNAYIDTESKKDYVLSSFLHPNAITVHFVHSVSNSIAQGSAKLPYKWGDKYTCYVITEGVYDKDYANSLAHELGHTLGLLHTHDKGRYTNKDNAELNNCNQESVNKNRNQEWYCWFKFSAGKKCDRNADGLCDTDADPNWKRKIGSDCSTYNITGLTTDYIQDNYGDYWGSLGNNNAMRNIMSYSRFDCRTEFTPMQKGVMYYSLLRSGLMGAQTNPAKFRSNPDLDVYEPDNYWFGVNPAIPGVFANKIELNTEQHHTFHHSNSSSDNWSACDIDWVYFFNDGGTRNFIIQTLAVDGKPIPDTKITLYNVNFSTGALGVQIATHDDISSSNKFSKIIQNLAFGYYAVKIENKITNVSLDGSRGHYYIRVDACYDKTLAKVTGSNSICGSPETYSVSNIPAGATVTWFQLPAYGLTLTPSGNTCIVTAQTRGDRMLYAVVSFCGMLDTFSKKITTNMPQYTYFASESYRTAYPFDAENYQCYGSTAGLSSVEYIAHYENYSNIIWTKISSYPTATSALWSSNIGGDPRKIKVHLRAANASLILKADVSNACGTISNTFMFFPNGLYCNGMLLRGMESATIPQEVDYYDAYMSHQILVITYKEEEENKSELMKIIVSDKMGNIIMEKTDASIKENTIQIDMSPYKSDNYYIILQYDDGNIEPQQVVKF